MINTFILSNNHQCNYTKCNYTIRLGDYSPEATNSALLKKKFLAPVETTTKADTTAALATASMSEQSHTAQPSRTLVGVEPVAGAVGGHPASPTHDDAVFREKLKHMGKSEYNV